MQFLERNRIMWYMSRKVDSEPQKNRAGTTAVEIAIVLPIFVLLLAAAFEFGRLNIIRHIADTAAYEAARHVIVPGATSAEAVAEAKSLLDIVSTRGATVTVNPATLGPETEEVSVTIDIPMSQNGWFIPRFSTSKIIRAQSRLKTERAQR